MVWKQRRFGWSDPSCNELPAFQVKGQLGRIDNPPAKAFCKRYVEKNRPVIVQGAAENWAALKDWNNDWLLSEKRTSTEVIVSRNGLFPDYETRPEPMQKVQMCLAEFTARALGIDAPPPLLAPDETYYIYGKPALFECLPHLIEHVPLPSCLADLDTNGPFLWMSSCGCTTPLHYDLINGFLTQVRGSKKVFLFDHNEHQKLYQRGANFPGMDNRERQSQIDIHNPDLARFPDFAQAQAWEATLSPGDALFIPSNWFHEVESLEFSISVAYTFAGGTKSSQFAAAAEKFKSDMEAGAADPLAAAMAQMNESMDLSALQGQAMQNPAMLEQMMRSPMVQEAMKDPDLMAQVMAMLKQK